MLENPTILGITDLASNSVVIRVIAKTESEKHYAIERELRRIIKATSIRMGSKSLSESRRPSST